MAELNLAFVHGPAIGYGRYGVELTASLRRRGVDVFDGIPEPGEVGKVCRVAAWVSVPTHARGWWKGQYPVISTMWEATRLPESFRESLHNFEAVIVPSYHNVELFSRYHPNVKLALLGVDPDVWHYTPRTPPERYFRFLIGGSGPRKGTDLAYRAFRTVFNTWPKDGPVPMLVMKSPRGEDYRGERIEIVSGRISAQEEVDLYASAHVYLQPSKGEGFGLQPLQALAQGCPTILTDAHGHESFAKLGHGLRSTLVPAGDFFFGPAGEWWEPNFDDLCEWMRFCYHNYDRCTAKAQHSAEVVASEFTWDHTATAFLDALGDEVEAPGPLKDKWFEPDVKRYPVVVNRWWQADIAGSSYLFEPGRTYWELADVKRILFETGVLDPVCLLSTDDTEVGLTLAQCERIGDYSASHSFCPTCHQRLGSAEPRAEALMA